MLSESSNQRVVIIGAGPTGLGAACALHDIGYTEWDLFEASDRPGGLARSYTDSQGFVWDVGGHVQFSHYQHFDELMDRVVGDDWLYHQREAWAWMFGSFVPYPVQNNIHRFPPEVLQRCLDGLESVLMAPPSEPHNLRDWLLAVFGEGLCTHFLFPYNQKVWAHPLEDLGTTWVSERVSVPDLDRIRDNVSKKRDDRGWGPNSVFRYPKRGGTGSIWARVAADLPASQLQFGKAVARVDPEKKRLYMQDESEEAYDILISTMPLNNLGGMCGRAAWRDAANQLKFSSTHVIGIGLAGETPDHLRTKTWMYFPESDCPFYRVTVFSNYSPYNVPEPGNQWSLMAEVSESRHKPVDADVVVEDVVQGMLNTRLIESRQDIVSTWYFRAEHGYPVPFRGRDAVVDPLLRELEEHAIFSRGRFGAWKYEISNQDHSLMQGVECVRRLFTGARELTLRVGEELEPEILS